MSFSFEISPIDNEAGDFHHRLSVEMFRAFAEAKGDRKITQRMIADTMGVDKSSVSRLLRGHGNPTARTISDFAFALGCKPTLTFEPILTGLNKEEGHASRRVSGQADYGTNSGTPETSSFGIGNAKSVYIASTSLHEAK